MAYELVVGMEVHSQLLTNSKMFCGCGAAYQDSPPNTHVCPVCLGMPGMLPVINQQAVTIVDYKTHNQLQTSELAMVAHSYKNQLNRYRRAAEKLWPAYEIKTVVIFTHYLKAFDVTP